MSKFFRQSCFFRTELLPQETPLFFTNKPITDNIDKIINDLSSIESEFFYTIPLNYQIPKGNNTTRTLSLLHPLSQINCLSYIMKYEFLILNHLKKSSFNIRKATKLNILTYNNKKVFKKKRDKIEQDYCIQKSDSNITSEELDKVVKKYFAYSKNHSLLKIIPSPTFIRSRNKYRYFLKLDIQNFFGSIYTHALGWAIMGEKNVGKSLTNPKFNNSFASATDKLLQKSNNNETNGIILGPELNRIISDLLLTTIDVDIKNNLSNFKQKTEYEIFRFIDDYFIFAISKDIIEEIEEVIKLCLSNYNLILNNSKKEIHETPYYIGEPAIDDTKISLEILNTHRIILCDSINKKRIIPESKIKINSVIGKPHYWNNFYNDILRITVQNKQVTRKIVLYVLKSLHLEIDEYSLNKTNPSSYIRNLYTALEIITSVYSTYLDFDTTHAYIRILIGLRNSLSKLKNNSGTTNTNHMDIINIEDKIFEHIHRVLKQNKKNLTNLTDLILFLESFDKKLSPQFLCEIIELHPRDYFTLCSVAHYIQDKRNKESYLKPRYKIVLKKLSYKINEIIINPPCSMNKVSPIFDSNYFYFLNDFVHYRPFKLNEVEIYKKMKKQLEDNINETKKLKNFIPNITQSSYYNWDLNNYDFQRLIINKLIHNNENKDTSY